MLGVVTIVLHLALAVGLALASIALAQLQVSDAPPSDPGVASATRDLNTLLAVGGVALAIAIGGLTLRIVRGRASMALIVVDVAAAALVWTFTPGADAMPLPAATLVVLAVVAAMSAGALVALQRRPR